MNAITYFKLKSPYEGDITKNCALTGSEVDNNFYILEGRDVKSVELKDGKVVVNLMNGEKLATDNITEGCVKGLTIDFDEVNGILTVTQNGVTQTITGFATNYNVGDAISVDGTLVGNGLAKSPVGISPVSKTGQYRPVKNIVKVTEGERLPSIPYVFPGDRYLTEENVNDYGYLYNYEGLKKIACALKEVGSEWRVPTKEDWDDMLDAVEPNEDYRNHTDARTNKYLGHFAGKFLKSKEYWKNDGHCFGDDNSEDTCIDYSDCEDSCACGKHKTCHPNYCGEYGSCHHKHNHDSKGLDKYGFKVVPAGYANEAKDYMYFKERAYFWTASNHEYRDAYIKAFVYNKSSVLQDVMASDNYMSVRLVKNFNGDNYNEREDILGGVYSTVLMPSMKHGKAIWTSVNISLGDCGCGCKHILPNDGQGMEYSKKYFINEWTGKEWLRKEILDGESVVVIKHNKKDRKNKPNKDYTEYRLVNGELFDVAGLIFDNVVDYYDPIIKEINDAIEDTNTKLNDEIERSTKTDIDLQEQINDLKSKDITELEERVTAAEANIGKHTQDIADLNEHLSQTDANITTVNENLVTAVNTINQNVSDGFNTINQNVAEGFNTINSAIEAERQIRETKDTELENAITKETEERKTDVEALKEEDVCINERIDEIERKSDEHDSEIEKKLEEETAARIAKDEELEAQLLTQEDTEFDKNSGKLTLKSKGGTNDVEVQFSFNFGTF